MTARAERDFYRALVELDESGSADEVLSRALELAVDAVEARIGYLAVGRAPLQDPAWFASVGVEDLDAVRAAVSATIVSAASVDGLIITHDAARDARFRGAASVRQKGIEQVLCAPLPTGVLYLQGRHRPGPFGDDDLRVVRAFVRHVGPLSERLRWQARWADDPTRAFREALQVGGLVGRSPELAGVFQKIRMVAPNRVPVLITGPSGSGKTAVAQAIHANGPRRDRPFETLNCALLTSDRLQVDLFGAAAGAYTGQVGRRIGLVGAAEGGTLFLDEVGELPWEAQSQLLTFLQDGTYRSMGDSHTQAADVRVIAATNRALPGEGFREDLYWRLAGVTIEMPPLSRRLGDLPELATHLVAELSRELGTPALPLSPSAYCWLEQQEWPGNIRELRNRLIGALLHAQDSGTSAVTEEHLGAHPDAPDSANLRVNLEAFRRRHVERVIRACGGNRARAAEALGVNRTYLYDLLKRLNLSDLPDSQPPGASGQSDDLEPVTTDRTP